MSNEKAANIIHLDADKLGDPYYDDGSRRLTFTGDGAAYVAEVLSDARAERTRLQLVGEYVFLYNSHDSAGLSDKAISDLLSEFSLALLGSSAVR